MEIYPFYDPSSFDHLIFEEVDIALITCEIVLTPSGKIVRWWAGRIVGWSDSGLVGESVRENILSAFRMNFLDKNTHFFALHAFSEVPEYLFSSLHQVFDTVLSDMVRYLIIELSRWYRVVIEVR